MNSKYNNHKFIPYNDFSERDLITKAEDCDYYICINCNCIVYYDFTYPDMINISCFNKVITPTNVIFIELTCEDLLIKSILE